MARKHRLHAFWSSDSQRLYIWGEHAKAPQGRRSRRRKRRAKIPTKRKHPFACRESVLLGLLGKLVVSDDMFPKGRQSELILLLPTGAQGPEPSPGLRRRRWRSTDGVVDLAPWVVPALVFNPQEAVRLLLGLLLGRGGGLLGDDLRAMIHVTRLTLTVMLHGHLLPTLNSKRTDVVSRWVAPLEEKYPAYLRICELALPPLGRSGIELSGFKSALKRARKKDDGWSHVSVPNARDIVLSAAHSMIDALARYLLRDVQMVSKVHIRRTQWGRKTFTHEVRAWLEALTLSDPVLRDQRGDYDSLQEQLEEWYTPPKEGDTSTTPPYQLGLWLSEPEGEQTDWNLQFVLQAEADPSLVIHAQQVWAPPARNSILVHDISSLQKLLLDNLKKAAKLDPFVERAIKSPKPSRANLSAQEAWIFLRAHLPKLQQAGFNVRVPNWVTRPPARLGLSVAMNNEFERSSGNLGAHGVASFDWALALDGQTLTEEELVRLVKLKRPFLKMRGQWVEVRPDELEKAVDFMRSHAQQPSMSLGDVMRLQSGAEEVQGSLEIVQIEAHGRIQELLEGKATRMRLRKAPPGFQGELRPYQRRGVSWMSFMEELGLGVCLADDMGLGKTIQLLALLETERSGGRSDRAESPGPTLIICPLSVVGNWKREAQRFTPHLSVDIHHGPDRPSGAKLAKHARKHDVIITTYGLAARDIDSLSKFTWHRVVLDEAQNIKNHTAMQSQAIFSIEASHRVAMTGTPVENRLSELWSIMNFLNPGLLGTPAEFRKKFSTPIERNQDQKRAKALRELCTPFVLRRLKTDKSIIKDLPEKDEFKVYCNLTREQVTLYKAIVDDMMEQIEASTGIQRKGLVLSAMTRLKQICNHPVQFLQDNSALLHRSGKLQRLDEIVEAILDSGERALIFTQFTTMGKMLQRHLQDRFGGEVLFLHGGASQKARDAMVQRFQTGTGPHLFLISLKAGGTGLTLTAANHVIHYDRWWNPAVENQATDRAYRIGQDKKVQVRKLICTGTLEERIDEMIDQKLALAESVIGAGEAGLTEMDTDALRQVLSLSEGVVEEEDET